MEIMEIILKKEKKKKDTLLNFSTQDQDQYSKNTLTFKIK